MTKTTKTPFCNQYSKAAQMRRDRLTDLGVSSYPSYTKKIKRTHLCETFNSTFEYVQDSEQETSVTLTGKIVQWRNNGKLIFGNIEDISGRSQLFFSIGDTTNYQVPKSTMTAGDIISVIGYPFRTEKGELTLKVTNATMVTKAMTPPPEKFHGLKDEETQIRKRYLHMLSDPSVRDTLTIRSKIISIIRNTFDKKDFLEMETMILQNTPGGANARPFLTHHNAMDAQRFLRISPELYLKQLIVGGFERVYEIGKLFRNEGVDSTHNPEFTSIEFYEAYATYEKHMKRIEKLFKKVYRRLNDNEDYILPYGDLEIDLNDWRRIPFREALISIGNVPDDVIDTDNTLLLFLKEQGVQKANDTLSLGELWELAFDEFVEEKLINPVFITEYPADISPLARRMDNNDFLTERFELFIAGRELANGFNELNDPVDQYNRFLSQVEGKNLDDDDDESMHMDLNFVEALMNAMPPTAGTGIGIDRMVMLFTNKHSIRDVIAFPAVK